MLCEDLIAYLPQLVRLILQNIKQWTTPVGYGSAYYYGWLINMVIPSGENN